MLKKHILQKNGTELKLQQIYWRKFYRKSKRLRSFLRTSTGVLYPEVREPFRVPWMCFRGSINQNAIKKIRQILSAHLDHPSAF